MFRLSRKDWLSTSQLHVRKFEALTVEPLEQRQMLSAVTVYAQGSTGEETMQLLIDDVVVQTWENVAQGNPFTGGVSSFRAEVDGDVSPDQVKVQFVNDLYDPDNGIDRNLRVDRIEITQPGFNTYETETNNVFSTGTWLPQDGITSGFGRGEVLHANGYFQFGGVTGGGSLIEVNASAEDGPTEFELLLDGNAVATFEAGDSSESFQYFSDSPVSADQVRIQFSSDVYDPENGIDVNLVVDNIVIDGDVFETEAESVFSTGTWQDSDGITPGFGRGETLHSNGYFQFSNEVQIEQFTLQDVVAGPTGQLFNDPLSGKVAALTGVPGTSDIVVQILNSDGSLLDSFGDNGSVNVTSIDPDVGPRYSVRDVDLFPDGSVLLTGKNFNFNGVSVPYLMKLRPDGSLDSGFLLNGLLTQTNLGIDLGDSNGQFEAIVSEDGKFAIVGNVWDSDSHFNFRYFTSDGELDTSRGYGGDLTIYPSETDTTFSQAIPLADGSFLFIYSFDEPGSNSTNTAVMKVAPNGLLDDNFGNDSVGLSKIQPNSEFSSFSAFAVDNNDRLVMVGNREIVRLTASGELDGSFGTFGRFGYRDSFTVENAGQRERFDRFDGLAVDSQNRIVVVGKNQTQTGRFSFNYDPATVIRITESGNWDNALDSNGIQLLPFAVGANTLFDDNGNLLLSINDPGPITNESRDSFRLARFRVT